MVKRYTVRPLYRCDCQERITTLEADFLNIQKPDYTAIALVREGVRRILLQHTLEKHGNGPKPPFPYFTDCQCVVNLNKHRDAFRRGDIDDKTYREWRGKTRDEHLHHPDWRGWLGKPGMLKTSALEDEEAW